VKLETPHLDEFVQVARLPGTEINFTVQMPDGSHKTLNINALFVDIHAALHSLHHFMDPDGAHHTGYPVVVKVVKPEDNPTNPGGATLGQ
jgi:hypothetical protein